jgi:hypothetical protein
MSHFASTVAAVAITIAAATPALMREISRKYPVCCSSVCDTSWTRYAGTRSSRIGVTEGGTVAADRNKNLNSG